MAKPAMTTRQHLIDKWNERSKQYEKMALANDRCADDGDPQDGVDSSTHYTIISDSWKLAATELSHLQE